MKILLSGWFSFNGMGATAGDLFSRDLVCKWLKDANIPFDVALAPPFEGGVNWEEVDPTKYTHVVFVCGPFGNGWPLTDFIPRFKQSQLIGLNLSMLESLETWNPFDYLIERDSSVRSNPDISFISNEPKVPVVGIVLVHPQKEYREKAEHEKANNIIQKLIDTREMATVHIDTRLDYNKTGLRTPSEVESLIARMDVVITTRLHGLVLALKNGVPAIAVDPILEGAKVTLQAKTIEWPLVFTSDVTIKDLQEAFNYCLTDNAREKARMCREKARKKVKSLRDEFISTLLQFQNTEEE